MNKIKRTEKATQENTVDIRIIIKRFTAYWYYLILSIAICLFLALLYNRYTRPTYSVSSTIQIRDDNNKQLGTENILEGMEMFSVKTNLENEKAILKSYSLAEKTINALQLGISYFQHGSIQTVNLYQRNVFEVDFDSTHLQLSGVEFFIIPINNNEYQLKFKCNNQNTYDIVSNRKNNKLKATIKYDDTHSFGEIVENDYISFVIQKTHLFDSQHDNILNKKFSFIIHPLDKLSKKYVQSLCHPLF